MPNEPSSYRNRYGEPQYGRRREHFLESQRNKLVAVVLAFVALLGAVGYMMGRRSESSVESKEAAAQKEGTGSEGNRMPPPAEAHAPAVAPERPAEPPPPIVESEPWPATLPSYDAPTAPEGPSRFNDIDRVCGDLSVHLNYLCLLNQGGARLVLTEDLASFRSRALYHNGISISVEGQEHYRLDFGPPKGEALVPGLYTEAMRWPFNEGPYAGIDVSIGSTSCHEKGGQFRVLEVSVRDDKRVSDEKKISRFLADFETSCNGAVGRISVGIGSGERIDLRRHDPSKSGIQ